MIHHASLSSTPPSLLLYSFSPSFLLSILLSVYLSTHVSFVSCFLAIHQYPRNGCHFMSIPLRVTHSLTYSLTHSPTHSLSFSLTARSRPTVLHETHTAPI